MNDSVFIYLNCLHGYQSVSRITTICELFTVHLVFLYKDGLLRRVRCAQNIPPLQFSHQSSHGGASCFKSISLTPKTITRRGLYCLSERPWHLFPTFEDEEGKRGSQCFLAFSTKIKTYKKIREQRLMRRVIELWHREIILISQERAWKTGMLMLHVLVSLHLICLLRVINEIFCIKFVKII